MNDAQIALIKLLDSIEKQYQSIAKLSQALHGAFLSANIAKETIANRCKKTADLIGQKL